MSHNSDNPPFAQSPFSFEMFFPLCWSAAMCFDWVVSRGLFPLAVDFRAGHNCVLVLL